MKSIHVSSIAAALLAAVLFTGCESSGDGGYYGSDTYPEYYGSYYDGDRVRPGYSGPRPSHPIAAPPPSFARPMPAMRR